MMAEQKLKNGANMNISEAGLSLIKKFEGCALESYLCPAGVWTIGYGHTKDVKEGDKIFSEEHGNVGGAEGLAVVPKGQEEAVIESAEECPGECIMIEP